MNLCYAYAGNTPINAVDLDGNLIIFVNGLTLTAREKALNGIGRNTK
jgi:hypothetical protein